MSTTVLENRIIKTEDRLDRLEKLILQQSINITKSQQETAELRIELAESSKRMEQGFAELRASQDAANKRMEQGFAELKETIAQVDKENKQGFIELRKSHKELNKKWGELSRRLGTIVEDLVAPSLERIFLEVTGLPAGSEKLMNVRVKRRHQVTREIREFDAIVESEEHLLVNETKGKLVPEDIPKFLAALEEFYSYFPKYEDKNLKIIGAMSSLHLDESLITALSKQGLLALAIGDTITTIKSPKGFEWKAF